MKLPETRVRFPSVKKTTPEGLVAVGGDASVVFLLSAYEQGIFPWPAPGQPLLWFSPHPRFVLIPNQTHVPRSLSKTIRKNRYTIRFDTAFERVMRLCSQTPRPGQDGTWITDALVQGYCELFELGVAHSVEAWEGDVLVGGLYGVSLGSAFFGESMFAHSPDASKVALVSLLGHLKRWGFSLMDCQVYTEHLARFGAVQCPRSDFMRGLNAALARPTRFGPWVPECTPTEACLTLLSGV